MGSHLCDGGGGGNPLQPPQQHGCRVEAGEGCESGAVSLTTTASGTWTWLLPATSHGLSDGGGGGSPSHCTYQSTGTASAAASPPPTAGAVATTVTAKASTWSRPRNTWKPPEEQLNQTFF